MIKCIHTGDLHLGSQFTNASFDGIYAKRRRLELWETFEKIVDRAREIKADFLLIAGDLFEEDYFTIGDIKRVRDKFKEIEDVNIIIATGNHDPFSKRSLYRTVDWSKNVFIFDTEKVEKLDFPDLNTTVWGYSWQKKEENIDLFSQMQIEDKNRINILLIHGDIFNRDSSYLPIDKDILESKGFDYVALGHIHKPQFVTKRICYCGSPEPLDFGELDVHGIVEGTIAKEKVSMSLMPFSKRLFFEKEICISEAMTYNEIVNKIKNCDIPKSRKENLYRLYLTGIRDRDIYLNIEDLYEVLSKEFYYVEIIDRTSPDYDLEKLDKENKNNMIGYFIEEMKNKGLDDDIVKDALYIGLEVLLKEKVSR